MATPNFNTILQGIATIINNLAPSQTPPPYVANFDFGNPTMGAKATVFDAGFIAPNGSFAGVNLPANLKCYFAVVQNVDPNGTVVIVEPVFPANTGTTQMYLGQNGIFVFYDPAATVNVNAGIQGLQLQGVGATATCVVMAAST